MNQSPPKPRRRWLQFSLKTLFVVTIFAAGYFAGAGTFIRRAQQLQQESISAEQAARSAEAKARLQAERQRLLAEFELNSLKAGHDSPNQPILTEEVIAARPINDRSVCRQLVPHVGSTTPNDAG